MKQELVYEEQMEEEPEQEQNVSMGKEKRSEIGLLDLPGVGAATAEKLTNVGFGTVIAIAVATPGEIVEATGISEAGARKIINAARDNLDMGFESGDQVMQKRERIVKISTGHKGFACII